MLRLRDNLVLASTKLKVRRVRLTVTLVVAGILFTILVTGSLVVRGTLHSLESFANGGLLNHFVTSVYVPSKTDLSRDPKLVARTQQLQKERLAAEAAEAKRLGIVFEASGEPNPVLEYDGPDGKERTLDLSQPAARQAISELTSDSSLAQVTAAAGIFKPVSISQSNRLASTGELTPIVQGAEQKPAKQGYTGGLADSIASFQNDLSAYDNVLLKPFLIGGASLAAKAGEPAPVLAPIDAVEKLLGLKALAAKASPSDKIARLGLIRSKAKNLVFEACYRNQAAVDLRNTATQQAADITAHKGDAAYAKPALLYGAATTPCSVTPVASDTRSGDDKALAAKQEAFKVTFGGELPQTRRVAFRIVGVLPQIGSLSQAQGVSAAISSLLTTSLGEGWFLSRQAVLQDPILAKLASDPVVVGFGSSPVFVDFPSRDAQKRFIADWSCAPSDQTTRAPAGSIDTSCSGKFILSTYGNPLAAFYDLGKGFNQSLRVLIGIIALLSGIIMMGTIGKIIADSRKETSVFRALGAKRLEIAQIYLLYSLILASFSFLIALGIGTVLALVVEARYSADLGINAVLAFNSSDLHKPFHLIGLNLRDFAYIYGFVLALGLISSVIPLLSNLRRNPIKDMREE